MFLDDSSLPPGLRVYAVGDVHGRADLLGEMFAMIDADLRDRPIERRRLVMLGDYTDRGPDSNKVIDMLIARGADPEWGDDFMCLRGNHDDWLETFLAAPDPVGEHFLRWGGMETLAAYGVDTHGPRRSNAELSHDLNRLLPATHRRFLARLKPFHVEGDYFFVHAGVRPGIPLEEQDPHDLMWIRGEFHQYLDSFGKVVIHGHTPNDEIEVRRNRINVDTYAYASGILSAVALEGRAYRFLQTGNNSGS
ncbi:MAG: serine/threonine protein phosphatase [Salaquimonas sp.]|jgi:serine/threonine protein phosphatase 1|nr:serine/threonine protein phosphatase [Salaquimonas sp.]